MRHLARASLLALPALLCACVDGEPLGQSVQAVHRVCATNTTLRGVDVSVYQGTIDWAAAARGGVRFAMIRQSHGTTTDTTFARNWAGARAAGILRGAYQYFDPYGDAAAQANALCTALLAAGFGPGDLPPMIDVEQPAPTGGPALPSPAAYTALVRTWMQTVRARLGVDGIIYSGGYYWDPYVGSTAFASNPLWHPQYPNYPGTIYQLADPAPLGGCPTSVSNAWSTWTFWQFAGNNGRAPGFTGAVDISIFNGTMADLNRLARVGVTPDAGAPDAASPADAATVDARADAAPPRDASALDGAPSDAVALPEGSVSDANAADASARDTASEAGFADAMGSTPAQPGCGCAAPGASPSARGTALLLLLGGLAAARRRSRRY